METSIVVVEWRLIELLKYEHMKQDTTRRAPSSHWKGEVVEWKRHIEPSASRSYFNGANECYPYRCMGGLRCNV